MKYKYIRTKDGRFIINPKEHYTWINNNGTYVRDEKRFYYEGSNYDVCWPKDILKCANTIIDLIVPNDLIFFVDTNNNKIPFYVEDIKYLQAWMRTHDIFKINEIYVKAKYEFSNMTGNDYILAARRNKGGRLCLI